MNLPELSPEAAPEFADAGGCKAWLEHVPLANVATAQHELLIQLELFNRFPTGASNRLEVMEALREAISFVQIEQAKRFSNRALPMAESELAVFADTDDLWEQARLGYVRCVQAAANGEPEMRPHAALVCQRALAYSGLKMFHHYRAYREVPPEDWRGLHQVYRIAESLGVDDDPVKDFLNRDVQDTSVRVAYARALLMALGNPNELSQRQLTFVAYLLERWGTKLEVLKSAVEEDLGVPPLVVDLAGDRSPERLEPGSATKNGEPRYLDTTKLAKSLRNRVGLLRKGESPAKLALGEDCVQPTCEQLLVFLYRQWCQAKPGRTVQRRRAAAVAEAVTEIPAIHYYVSGRAFRQPGDQKELSAKQRDEIATFGRVSTREEDDYSEVQGYALERWHIEDEAAHGLRIVRRAGEPGRRFSHGQLVAVRPSDAKSFMLGQVRWLMAAANGDLQAGVKLLPGLPAATAVRQTGLNVRLEKFVPGLSLTAVQALNSSPTLVLPVGWFKPDRIIEVFVETPLRVRLGELVERGADFERVAYEIVG
jgi:cyclic-di-GMP-binding protein